MPKRFLRTRLAFYLIAYMLTLFLMFDFGDFALFYQRRPSPRVRVPQYSHGLVSNFDGVDLFGRHRYPFFTNNLGFRDSRVRQISLQSETRRILLMGDSFTEAVGVKFEQSFAGLLYLAGKLRRDPIEFLNAGAISYSPVYHYWKIEWLISCRLEFDEVIPCFDISDVKDEATDYFDLDFERDEPLDCAEFGSPRYRPNPAFVVTSGTIQWVRHVFRQITGSFCEFQFWENPRAAWAISNFDLGSTYTPLGIERGVERSRENI